MLEVSDRIAVLKKLYHHPDTPEDKKEEIIEYFKEYNDVFYGDIDIDSFFRQLMDLTENNED